MTDQSNPSPNCPDILSCSARESHIGDFVYCLNEIKSLCDFKKSFGNIDYCHHPKKIEIVSRSTSSDKYK